MFKIQQLASILLQDICVFWDRECFSISMMLNLENIFESDN